MAHLSLSLLGPFQATLGGELIAGLKANKVRALLAYLAVEASQAHPRAALATLLWPERSDRAAAAYAAKSRAILQELGERLVLVNQLAALGAEIAFGAGCARSHRPGRKRC